MADTNKFKNFWTNYWYQYKGFTIIGIIILVFIAFFAWELINYPDNDMTITVICDNPITEFKQGLQTDFDEVIDDVNGNNKKDVGIVYISSANEDENRLVDVGIIQGAYVELLQNETILAFIEPRVFNNYVHIKGFLDLTELTAGLNIPEENLYILDGKVYGVNVKNNKYLNSKGMPADKDLYMTLVYEKDNYSERQFAEQKNAKNVFKSICNLG